MVEYKNKFRVATTQIAPVWLDAQATVDKAIAWAAEAADNGAELIAFPEVFVPGYPYHLWGNSALAGMAKFTIPDDKHLIVEMHEKNGGRHQSFIVENEDLVRAREISELEVK